MTFLILKTQDPSFYDIFTQMLLHVKMLKRLFFFFFYQCTHPHCNTDESLRNPNTERQEMESFLCVIATHLVARSDFLVKVSDGFCFEYIKQLTG